MSPRGPATGKLGLTAVEYAELVRRAADRRQPAAGRRARLLLLLNQGKTWAETMAGLKCSRGFVARWLRRFQQGRMQGLGARHLGRRPATGQAALERRIVRAAAQRTARGRPRWSRRSLAQRLSVSHMTVHRVWEKHGLR